MNATISSYPISPRIILPTPHLQMEDSTSVFTLAECKKSAIENIQIQAESLFKTARDYHRIAYNLNLDSQDIVEKELNGENILRPLIAIQRDLCEYSKQHDSPKLQSVMAVLAETATYRALFKALYEASKEGKDTEKTYHMLCSQIAASIGEMDPSSPPKVFVGGWMQNSGHAILYEFRCIEKDHQKWIEFSIINRGLGLENHGKVKEGRIENFVITDIDPQDVTTELIEGLLKGGAVKENKKETLLSRIAQFFGLEKDRCEKGIGKIYKIAKKHFIETHKGKVKSENIPRHKIQQNGTCAARCTTAWVHEQLGEEAANFKLFMVQKSRKSLTELYYRLKPNARSADYEKEVATYRKPSLWTRFKVWFNGRMTTAHLIALLERVEKSRRKKIPQEIIPHS